MGGRDRLAATCSSACCHAVPSALRVFTAEFGMGSGVDAPAVATRRPRPPGNRRTTDGRTENRGWVALVFCLASSAAKLVNATGR